jgi:oxysterol-binding protein-related protein 3/6/7
MSSSPHTPSHTKGASQITVVSTVIFQGWLLKKRRKKMQGKPSFPLTLSEYANRILPGFARRYFTLYQTGLLSYSFEPGKPSRDQLSIPHAAISTYPGRKDIHIDSHNATFHLKCLSSDDFNKWMAALRRFIAADGRRSSLGLSTPRATHLSRSAAVVDEMGTVCFSQVIITRV